MSLTSLLLASWDRPMMPSRLHTSYVSTHKFALSGSLRALEHIHRTSCPLGALCRSFVAVQMFRCNVTGNTFSIYHNWKMIIQHSFAKIQTRSMLYLQRDTHSVELYLKGFTQFELDADMLNMVQRLNYGKWSKCPKRLVTTQTGLKTDCRAV